VKVRIERINGVNVITVPRELDLLNSDTFKNEVKSLIQKGDKLIVLDFSRCDYLDSSGIGAVVALHKNALMNGGGLALASLQESVMKVMQITTLDKILRIFPSVEEAVEALKK